MKPLIYLFLILTLASPLGAVNDPQTEKFLQDLDDYYYCLTREGLKSFQCEATATFSGQLPKELQKAWKGFDWKKSQCVFDFSYTGGEVMPILTFASNGGDPEATGARMREMSTLPNLLLLAWGLFETQPFLGPKEKIGRNFKLVRKPNSCFSIVKRRRFSTITADFDDKDLAKRILVRDPFGTRETKLSFVQLKQGAALQHAEFEIPTSGTPIYFDLDVQYQPVQGFQMPSTFTFSEKTQGRFFQATYKMSNYQIQRADEGATAKGRHDTDLVPSASEGPNTKHFLWRVRSPNATVYLLGSIHVRPNVPLQVPEIVEKSFDSADYVGFECDLSKEAEFNKERDAYFDQHCTYPEGDNLMKHLTPQDWEKVRFLLQRLDISVEMAIHYKPYILKQLAFKRPTVKNYYITKAMGIDNIFLRKAMAAKKPVFGMEFWYEGFKVLDGLDDHDQLHSFIGDFQNTHNYFRFYDELLADWKCGNTADLDSLYNLDVTPEDKDINDKLVGARNMLWLSQFDRIFQTRGTYFIVVGSAHLVGEKGLPNLLKQKGYSVEQL